MKKRLFARSIDEQRMDIRERWDRYRVSILPQCHMLVALDDYDAIGEIGVKSYEMAHKITLVPSGGLAEHKASGRCKSCLSDSNAA